MSKKLQVRKHIYYIMTSHKPSQRRSKKKVKLVLKQLNKKTEQLKETALFVCKHAHF